VSRVSSAVRCASAKQRLLQHPPAPLRRASQHAGGRLYTLPNPQSAGAACCAGGCLIRGRWGEAKLSVQGCLSPASWPSALGCFRVVLAGPSRDQLVQEVCVDKTCYIPV